MFSISRPINYSAVNKILHDCNRQCRMVANRFLPELMATLLLCSLSIVAHSDEILRIGGSGTDLGSIRIIAKQFMKANPKVRVQIPASMGSGGAVKAVIAGHLDIGLTSRALKKNEIKADIKTVLYAKTPVIFAVADSSTISSVTRTQLAAFYSGSKSHWDNGEAVRILLRPKSDSDTMTLLRGYPELREPMAVAYKRRGVPVQITDQDMANALVSVPGALGTSTLALVLSEQRPLKALRLDGVAATVEALSNEQYPLYKKLYFVLPKKLSSTSRAFLNFVLSSESQQILYATGHQTIEFEPPEP